jgi:serine protease Do
MIATRAGGSEGVGFALPVNTVVRVYNDIIRDGRVTRGSIGITFQRDTKPETFRALGVDHGVIVSEVKEGGPADKAGMKAEDIIVGVNGKGIRDESDFMDRIADLPVGTPATLAVDRDGKKLDLKITIEDRMVVFSDKPEIVGENVQPGGERQPEATDVKFGIGLRPLNDQEVQLSPEKRGVIVTRVEPDSFAEEVDMHERDIIMAINRQPVNSIDDVKKVQQRLKPGDAVAFHIARPQVTAARLTRGSVASDSLYLSGRLPDK